MLMNYIVRNGKLIAVAGNDETASFIAFDCIRDDTDVLTLNQLFDNKVEIPLAFKWIVESDRKHQEREVASRNENLCDAHAMSFKKKD